MAKGYWYCPNCKEEVSPETVTFQELHDLCGHPVRFIEPGGYGISRDEFMDFFRDGERLSALSPDDRAEIFTGILAGSGDITAGLLNGIIADYGVGNLKVVEVS
jgi:hypothetical protein